MADKDIGERDVNKSSIPDAAVLIVHFIPWGAQDENWHVRKWGITAGQRTACLEMVQKLAYASSAAKYTELYEEFQRDASKEVIAYFNKSWHPII